MGQARTASWLLPALVAAAALVVTGVATEISWWQLAVRGPFGLLVRVTGWLAIAVGTVAWARRAKVRLATLLVLLGVALFLRDFRESAEPLVHAVGLSTAYAWTALAAHVALAWPDGVLRGRGTRALVAACYVCALGSQLMRVLDPEAGDLWPLAGSASVGLLASVVVVVVGLRWWRRRSHERSDDLIVLSAVTLGVIGACVGFLNLADGSDAHIDAVPVVVGLSVVPVAILAYLKQRAHLLEISASRRRIAEEATVERRRIQHDLHDGAQQELVGAKLLLEDARRAMSGTSGVDLDAVQSKMDAAHCQLAKAIEDLHTYVEGIYPEVLENYGLRPALDGIARQSPKPVVIDVPDHRWSPEVEHTAYFCVKEAIANALKHANAERIAVTAINDGTALIIRIQDDGIGGALPPWDGGLRMFQERLTTFGGRITDFRSVRGEGTLVALMLPCFPAA